ncbi:odorant receptor 4-like isoform X2 [Linepithema humile]
MTNDWKDCAHSDISMQKAMSKAKISDRIINGIFILHAMTIVTYCVGLIFADVDVTDQTTELPHFSKIDIPLDIKTLRVYRLLLITQFFHLLLCAWMAGITNALLLSLTLHAGGQFEILCYWLTQLVPYENENKHKSIVPTTDKIIQKHQKIIHFAEKIESLYTYIALLQFTSNTIMICTLGFLIVTAIGSPNAIEVIIRSILFYVITSLEAFIFCYAGEYLKNKSNAVSLAVYDTPWYNLKPKDSRVLLFIMKRSQKQLMLTAGKMMDLSLESFTSIINASGSYLSMLLAMQ